MKFETAKKVAMSLLAACCILCILALVVTTEGDAARDVTSYAALGCGMLGVVCLVAFCKCPYCGTRIFRNLMNVKVCPNCRRDLQTGIRKKGKGGKR